MGDINTLIIDGHYRVETNANLPPATHFGQVLVLNGNSDTVTQIASGYHTGYMAYRQSNYNFTSGVWNWTKWVEFATATPPQEYDLPLSEGVSVLVGAKHAYSKDQFNKVIVHISVDGSTVFAAGDNVIGSLPVGFRPSTSVHSTGWSITGNGTTVGIYIHPDGTVHASFPDENQTTALAQIVFIAN